MPAGFCKIHKNTDITAFHFIFSPDDLFVFPGVHFLKGSIKLHHVENVNGFRPSARTCHDGVTFNFLMADLFCVSLFGLADRQHGTQVEEDIFFVGSREVVTVESHPCGGSQFCIYVKSVQ